jgi:hypothetical protein
VRPREALREGIVTLTPRPLVSALSEAWRQMFQARIGHQRGFRRRENARSEAFAR